MAPRAFPSALVVLALLPALCCASNPKQPTLEKSCPKAAPGAKSVTPPPVGDYNCDVQANEASPKNALFWGILSGCKELCLKTAKENNTLYYFWKLGGEIGGNFCACFGTGYCTDSKLFSVSCGPVGSPTIGVFDGPNGTTASFPPPPPKGKPPSPPKGKPPSPPKGKPPSPPKGKPPSPHKGKPPSPPKGKPPSPPKGKAPSPPKGKAPSPPKMH